MAKKTLRDLFNTNQDKLRSMLQGLELPKDAKKIEDAVNKYLSELFDNDGEFRLQLTQAEDYILQSAMSLLDAQRSIVSELSNSNSQAEPVSQHIQTSPKPTTDGINKNVIPYSIGATAVGGIVGGVVVGTWGAVFGAIAGTAITLYCVTSADKSSAKTYIHNSPQPKPTTSKQKLDVDKFIQIVASVCNTTSNLMQHSK